MTIDVHVARAADRIYELNTSSISKLRTKLTTVPYYWAYIISRCHSAFAIYSLAAVIGSPVRNYAESQVMSHSTRTCTLTWPWSDMCVVVLQPPAPAVSNSIDVLLYIHAVHTHCCSLYMELTH